MTRTRSDARRDYRQFPAAYTQLLEAFETGGKAVRLGPMPLKAAKSAKRDFYRFKGFLMRAVDDAQDDYARELMTVFNRASVRLEGAGDDAYMIVDHNPLVQAVERLGLTVEELRPRHAAPDILDESGTNCTGSGIDSIIQICSRDSRRLIYPASCDECIAADKCLARLPPDNSSERSAIDSLSAPDALLPADAIPASNPRYWEDDEDELL